VLLLHGNEYVEGMESAGVRGVRIALIQHLLQASLTAKQSSKNVWDAFRPISEGSFGVSVDKQKRRFASEYCHCSEHGSSKSPTVALI